MRCIGGVDFQPNALRRKRGANCHLYDVAIVRIFFCTVFLAGIAGRSAADLYSRIVKARLLIVETIYLEAFAFADLLRSGQQLHDILDHLLQTLVAKRRRRILWPAGPFELL